MESAKDIFMQMREEEANENKRVTVNTGVTTINTQSFLTASKALITEKAQAVVDRYTDGHNSPVEGLIVARKLIEFGEQIKDNLLDAAANELKLASKESRDIAGNKISEQMVGVRYSYKDCGDPIWNELNEKIKDREKFLQSIKGSKQELIEETGEVVQIFEPVKSGKLSLVIKY